MRLNKLSVSSFLFQSIQQRERLILSPRYLSDHGTQGVKQHKVSKVITNLVLGGSNARCCLNRPPKNRTYRSLAVPIIFKASGCRRFALKWLFQQKLQHFGQKSPNPSLRSHFRNSSFENIDDINNLMFNFLFLYSVYRGLNGFLNVFFF